MREVYKYFEDDINKDPESDRIKSDSIDNVFSLGCNNTRILREPYQTPCYRKSLSED